MTLPSTLLRLCSIRAVACHKKFDKKELIAKSILVKDGSPHRVHDTVWAGHPQTMVNSDGSAKDLRTILAERGINTVRMKADDIYEDCTFKS